MIEICALASGSNGNCYYTGNQTDAVLVDAGISARQLLQRFRSAGLDPGKVKAIFITHEHSDHTRGMQVLSKRLGITVYMTARTYYALPPAFRPPHYKFFTPGETVSAGSFLVHTFLKNHDAVEPCSFILEHHGKTVGVFTDIGEACGNVKNAVARCHALFMECNYDEEMLRNGSYPVYLKNRVASAHGHLSNTQAVELVRDHGHPQLECVFLSHISKENNTSDIAMDTFRNQITNAMVLPTSRSAAGEVYRLSQTTICR